MDAIHRSRRPRDDKGITLLELLVVLAMGAVVLSLGVPSLQQLTHTLRGRLEANRLHGAVQLARNEAATRNAAVSLCPSSYASGGALRCEGTYDSGWLVLSGDTTAPEPGNLLRVYPPPPSGYSIQTRSGVPATRELIYSSDGATRRNATFTVCPPARQSRHWSLVINRVGRARLARDWGNCGG
ncbi:MAG: GspH/FimT family pseudopilin [Parahaliea sp.]